ncbi:hypothetical protein [Burkholderia contaminans]|uniref:hypothetical protein n=1 Tax=Burkholderia contaminans TaxID=488447 RepID=UPI003D67E537
MNFEEIAILCEDKKLSSLDVDAACQVEKISRLEFFDRLAHWLANAFLEGRRDFTFCDSAANNMMYLAEWNLAEFAWSVFLAFDNGEFYRSEDSEEIDPSEKYTKPMMRRALSNRV